MEKFKLKRFIIPVLGFVMLVVFSGCGQAKKVQHQEEKQDGSSWEKDMNKLIEKATPKDNK